MAKVIYDVAHCVDCALASPLLPSLYHCYNEVSAKERGFMARSAAAMCAWMKFSCSIKSAGGAFYYVIFLSGPPVFFSRATKREQSSEHRARLQGVYYFRIQRVGRDPLVFWYFHLVASSRTFSSRVSVLRPYTCGASEWTCDSMHAHRARIMPGITLREVARSQTDAWWSRESQCSGDEAMIQRVFSRFVKRYREAPTCAIFVLAYFSVYFRNDIKLDYAAWLRVLRFFWSKLQFRMLTGLLWARDETPALLWKEKR